MSTSRKAIYPFVSMAARGPRSPSPMVTAVPLPSDQKRIIVKFEGASYDVTEFLADHPGGSDIVEQWNGQDISAVFGDAESHKHSKFARSLLQKYLIKEEVEGKAEKSDDLNSKCGKFIDLDRPLIYQMWNLRISKEEYLHQVHLPRHLGRPARFFESDFLEIFTKTPWWFIPLFWGPVLSVAAMVGGSKLMADGMGMPLVGLLWFFGLFMWTVLEYTFHRFLFHMTALLPSHPIAFTTHFLFHGVHHFLPMDHYRLVMPPLLFSFFCTIVYSYLSLLIPQAQLQVMFSGTLMGYIVYDMMHYYFHHGGTPPIKHVAEMKTYHMDHHYVDPNLGFGVSSKIWDRALHTELPPHK